LFVSDCGGIVIFLREGLRALACVLFARLTQGRSKQMTTAAADQALLDKLNAAVAEHNAAEKAHEATHVELVSRSKAVGLLLLEARKRHPKLADFEAFLKRVNGLKLSRAYDLLRLAGGRTTDEELRQDARERQRKSRAKKAKIPPSARPATAEPKPKPDSVTTTPVTETPKTIPAPNRVTESPEISVEQRRRENANLGMSAVEKSKQNLEWFSVACQEYLPKITAEMHRREARRLVAELTNAKVA
jgi:hypothetical protein